MKRALDYQASFLLGVARGRIPNPGHDRCLPGGSMPTAVRDQDSGGWTTASPWDALGIRDLAPVTSLTRAGDPHLAAVLGDGATGDIQPMVFELPHEFIVAVGLGFVLVVDDFLQFESDGVPGHIFAIVTLGASDEEAFEREDAARRLDPLIIHGSTDRRHVHAHFVGNLLHLERFEGLGAFFDESRLVIDDRLSHFGQRIASLLDGFDQPLSGIDLALNEFAFFGRGLSAHQAFAIVVADAQAGRPAVFQQDLVGTIFLAFQKHIGSHGRGDLGGEVGSGLGIQFPQLGPGILDAIQGIARLALNGRQPIVPQVFQ